jgi:eukaryotic-like serine/threonine-protein kinase
VNQNETLVAPVPQRADRMSIGDAGQAARAHADRPPSTGEDSALVLGRYRLLERLGAGGFGVVWSARDELLHRDVAVKRIELPPDGDRERATREALAAARLAHPAIVALYEACAEDDAFYLISELVEGETLAQLIADDALCDEEILEIGCALCDALLHAHARGVIHRDVKPQNVLVPDPPREPAAASATGNPPLASAKLTDFGGAQLSGEDALTRTGDVLGTIAYMAPEQIEGREALEQTDLYALALVLYEALSGVNPVRGPNPAATARRIGRALPALERHRRDLPRQLTRALDAALDPEPGRRRSLPELRQALQEGLSGHRPRLPLLGARRLEPIPAPSRASGPTAGQPLAGTLLAPHPDEDLASEPSVVPRPSTGWLTLPRTIWMAAMLGLCVWQITSARPGLALFALCAALPVVLLVRRPGPLWLFGGLAPLLGRAGLAGAFPAIAGQPSRWRSRAMLGALGYWWLRLAEPLLDGSSPGARLWLGAPAGTAGARVGPWEGSVSVAATHALAPLLSVSLLVGVALWALAAALLPWIVRGRTAMLDALAAIAWAAALAAATAPLLASVGRSAHQPSPRGVLAGAAVGGLLAVASRAVRGPVAPVSD